MSSQCQQYSKQVAQTQSSRDLADSQAMLAADKAGEQSQRIEVAAAQVYPVASPASFVLN